MVSPKDKAGEAKKEKLPTSIKRLKQNEKRRVRNKAARTRVKSSIKSLLSQVAAKKGTDAQLTLAEVQGLVDKAVKKGIFKQNKGSRIKSRMAARVMAVG